MPARQNGLDLRRLNIVRRRGDTSGRYANAAKPQWMRTLENKYDKLHRKILLSARLNDIRTHNVRARIPRDGVNSRERTITYSSNITSRNIADIVNSEEFCKNNSNVNLGKFIDVTKTISNTRYTDVEDDVCSTSVSEGHKTSSIDPVPSMLRLKKNAKQPKVFSRHPQTKLSINVNTTHCRERYFTSRSCPAAIQTSKQMRPPSRLSPIGTNERGLQGFRPLKTFAKMSSEAQHAVSETLIEMGAKRLNGMTTESPSPVSPRDNIFQSNGPPLKERHCTKINNRFIHDCDQHNRGFGELSPINRGRHHAAVSNVSGCSNISRDRHQAAASNVSVCSSDFTEHSNRMQLPQLLVRSSRLPGTGCIENLETVRLRVPAMGKYDIKMFREPTFQITAPDFDIRFRDVIISERRGSYTPPLEIKEKAIEKCQEWLKKYV